MLFVFKWKNEKKRNLLKSAPPPLQCIVCFEWTLIKMLVLWRFLPATPDLKNSKNVKKRQVSFRMNAISGHLLIPG